MATSQFKYLENSSRSVFIRQIWSQPTRLHQIIVWRTSTNWRWAGTRVPIWVLWYQLGWGVRYCYLSRTVTDTYLFCRDRNGSLNHAETIYLIVSCLPRGTDARGCGGTAWTANEVGTLSLQIRLITIPDKNRPGGMVQLRLKTKRNKNINNAAFFSSFWRFPIHRLCMPMAS
jgi:hypothetical protein